MSLRRLHQRIYVSLLVVALLSLAGAGLTTHALLDRWGVSPHAARLLAEAHFIAGRLPAAEAPPEETARALDDLGSGLRLHAAVVDAGGSVVASTLHPSPRLAQPGIRRLARGPAWVATSAGLAFATRLTDGRVLALWPRERQTGLLLVLLMLFALLAIFCVPVARGLTRRLEALERGVADLGSGRLGTRVVVQGRDEIARLAERFNWSAERIERLVEAQRRVLWSASHELRSPLARVRMALELIRDAGGPEIASRVAGAVTDIGELDAMVDDLLLASRIETGEDVGVAEEVDLAPLVAEETARAGAHLTASAARVTGDPRLLRRLVRNLLDNAVRHGGGTEVTVELLPLSPRGARLQVADRGPGIPVDELDRVFTPFYRLARAADSGGVGLGLALVRQIAAWHGGTAVCRQRNGGGAVFEVTLPVAPGSAVADARAIMSQ